MTSISKNVYIDKLGNIVNKYNNTYQSTIKIKPVDVKSSTYIDSSKENNNKIVNLKLVALLEYQNIKIFLKKFTFQIDLESFLWLKKFKILCCGHVISDLNGEKIMEHYTKTNCKKQIKNSLELKK